MFTDLSSQCCQAVMIIMSIDDDFDIDDDGGDNLPDIADIHQKAFLPNDLT